MENSPSATASPALEPTRVRASEPADLLSYIDHSLGFRPRSSVVGLTRRGTTIGALVRVDLPSVVEQGQVDPHFYADRIASHLKQDQRATDSLFFILKERVHPEDPPTEAAPEPISDSDLTLMKALNRSLAEHGMPVREVWLVDHGCLWHVGCPDVSTCSPHGGSVARSEISSVNATFILEGSVVERGPEVTQLPLPQERPSLALIAALEHASARADDPEFIANWMQRWESVLDGTGSDLSGWSRQDQVHLIAGLACTGLRDAVMASAAFTVQRAVSGAEQVGAIPVGTAQRVGCAPAESSGLLYVSAPLADTVRAPDWDRMDRLHDACRVLLPHSAGSTASALQCIAAWIDWSRGRGTWSGTVIDQCLDRDPHYDMARLLEQLLNHGEIAGWAAREEVAWRRLRP